MYQRMISEVLDCDLTIPTTSPRIIEAWMRLEHGTLDGLSRRQFQSEVAVAAQCAAASTVRENESLAKSYGL